MKQGNIENPVGKQITVNGSNGMIIGVVKNAQLNSLRFTIPAEVYHLSRTFREQFQTIFIKIRSGENDRQFNNMAASLAQAVAPVNGTGLALVGPFEDNKTFVALHGPGDIRLTIPGRYYRRRESNYIRRWIVIQGLDFVRRVLVGELRSPVDWD